jgi:hypothetical protein
MQKPADPISDSPAPISPPTGDIKFPKTIQGIKFTNYSHRANHQYPEETCVLTSVAPKTSHGSPLRNDHTECIFRGGKALKTVFSTPKFPLPMPTPNGDTYEILPTPNTGLGIFASRDIKMGDLVLSERPLIVVPMSLPPGNGPTGDFDWDTFIQPCFDRLSPDNKAAYRALANSHTEDGSGPLHGVVLTNGFTFHVGEGERLVDSYTAVYKELSRANHRYSHVFSCSLWRILLLMYTAYSCRPNVFKVFALSTFSAQIRAVRDIKKGDEIFVPYINLSQTTPERQASLVPYGFRCTCASCTSPSHDYLFQKTSDRVEQLSASFNTWVRDRSLPRDHIIKPALALAKLSETNGFHLTSIYGVNYVTLMRCYVALGDLPNAMKYANICGLWTFIQTENAEFYERMKNPQVHRRDPMWGTRA